MEMPEQNVVAGAEETIFNSFAQYGIVGVLLLLCILGFVYAVKVMYKRLLSEDGLITIAVRDHLSLMAKIGDTLPELTDNMETQSAILIEIRNGLKANGTADGLSHMCDAMDELTVSSVKERKQRVKAATSKARAVFGG